MSRFWNVVDQGIFSTNYYPETRKTEWIRLDVSFAAKVVAWGLFIYKHQTSHSQEWCCEAPPSSHLKENSCSTSSWPSSPPAAAPCSALSISAWPLPWPGNGFCPLETFSSLSSQDTTLSWFSSYLTGSSFLASFSGSSSSPQPHSFQSILEFRISSSRKALNTVCADTNVSSPGRSLEFQAPISTAYLVATTWVS